VLVVKRGEIKITKGGGEGGHIKEEDDDLYPSGGRVVGGAKELGERFLSSRPGCEGGGTRRVLLERRTKRRELALRTAGKRPCKPPGKGHLLCGLSPLLVHSGRGRGPGGYVGGGYGGK